MLLRYRFGRLLKTNRTDTFNNEANLEMGLKMKDIFGKLGANSLSVRLEVLI